MIKQTAVNVFEALSSGIRLDVFRLLVKKDTEGLVAGESAAARDLPPTNLSFHRKALAHAGLVTATQEGRFQRYHANLTMMADLVAYMTRECCGGRPLACGDFSAQAIRPSCSTRLEPA